MDRGTWTLRCQNCSAEFEVQIKPGQRIVQYAKEAACPHCLNIPDPDVPSSAVNRWHHIIGFRHNKDD